MNLRDTFDRLRHLAREIEALSVDWPRFAALAEQAGPASPEDALAVLGRLLALAGLRRADAKRATRLLAEFARSEAAVVSASPEDFAELLRGLAAAGDAEGLALALHEGPQSDGYVAALRELVETSAIEDTNELRALHVHVIMDHPRPGRVVTEELAGAIVDAVTAWHQLKNETPEQRAIREAFAYARALMDRHGEDDPRTMDAVIKALELQDPGCCARMFAQGGITMPAPTHCTAEGAPLYSLEAVADALGADVGELQAIAEDMEAVGLDMRRTGAGRLH